MLWSNPLLVWCRSLRKRRSTQPLRRPLSPPLEQLETRCVPASFIIGNFNDGGSGTGSLREAILRSNALYQNQTNTITLNAGTYTLSRAGVAEDNASTGDLDITGTQTMVIQGAGAGVTFIDAKQLDRVFDITGAGVTVTFKDLTITGGYIESSPTYTTLHGGGILNRGGRVTLNGVTVTKNQLDGYIDTAGGGVASEGGTLTIINSTITANTLGYNSQFAGNLNGANGARGNDAHPTGFDGTAGSGGPAGGLASGGGVFVRNTTATITSSTIGMNSITGGVGVAGGNGGSGGHSRDNATSFAFVGPGGGVIPGQLGGSGAGGAVGGNGGDANGAGIAADGGTLTITDVRVTGNSATGGVGGTGGNGGNGGAYLGRAGAGANGGSGGAARGAVYAGGNAKLTISGTTIIENNTATGGVGGVGGRSGTPGEGYAPGLGFAGPSVSANGGTGGMVAGAGLTIENATVASVVSDVVVTANTATGGEGGQGGGGHFGHNNLNNGVDISIAGGQAANGGAGGDVQGAGVFFGNAPVTMTGATIKLNVGKGGVGGYGGFGGYGGEGGTSTIGLGAGTPGAAGGRGGNGGNGGNAHGGGLFATGSRGITISSSTLANNSVTAGDGGHGGNGGTGGDGGYGFFEDGPGARGGDGGNGSNAGVMGGAGFYAFNSASGTTAAITLVNSTVAFNSMSGGSGGGAGSGGGGGDGHGGRAAGGTNGKAGNATTSTNAAGVFANGNVSLLFNTVAYNDSGISVNPLSGINVLIKNTITAKNTSFDVAGPFTTGGNNLFGVYNSASASGANATDLRGSVSSPLDPKLPTTLENKGGKTDVLYPLVGSPAIDGGSTVASVTADQRGRPRPFGEASDIGAVEYAVNSFKTFYTFPTSVAAGPDTLVPVTVFIGDGVTRFDSVVNLNLLPNQLGLVTITASDLPAGWSLTPTSTGAYSSTGYVLRGTPTTPGTYTFTLRIRVDATLIPTSRIEFLAFESVNSLTQYVTLETLTVKYPVPTITSLSPGSIDEGSSVNLTVIGTGFGPGSVVKWNGVNMTTQFINRTTLLATIPASSNTDSGTAQVTVFNPTPGGGTSVAQSYAINNVAPTGAFPDRYVVYPGSGTVDVVVVLRAVTDPSTADTASGFRYSLGTDLAGLASSYSSASPTPAITLPVTGVGTTIVYARVFDKDGDSRTYTATVHSLASNSAPILTGANNLPTINEDNVTNPGVLVSSLIAGKFSDADAPSAQGIAVIGLTGTTTGTWQWSINGGITWANMGSVSNTNARLLGSASTDRVRYVPDTQDGTIATIMFRAWDQTDGRFSGVTAVNVSANGGTKAYSATTATATQIVTEVNDRPTGTTLNYSMAKNGVLRIPITDVIAASTPGPAPENGQRLTLVGLRVDSTFGVIGTATVSGGNIVFRPMTGFSGNALIYYTVQDNGTTNGVISPAQGGGTIVVYVDPTADVVAVDDVLAPISPGAPAFIIASSTLTANDIPTYGFGSVTITSVGNPVGGTVTLLDAPGHNARIEFTPAAAFTGIASFTYTITDDDTSRTTTATVRFIVQPNAVTQLPLVTGTTATWADMNGDGNLDAVIGSAIFLGDGAGNFSGGDGTLGLPALTSVAFGDYNRDGYLDVLGITAANAAAVYTYDHTTSNFVDANVPFASTGYTKVDTTTWADVDGDGDLDIFLSGTRKSGSSTFPATGVYATDGPFGAPNPGELIYVGGENSGGILASSASFADVDGDGDLDFLANTNAGPRLYRNDYGGFGAFTPPRNPLIGLLPNVSSALASSWGDYDGDGFPDFAATAFNSTSGDYELYLYHNNGKGTFTQVGQGTTTLPVATSKKPITDMGWADVNSDGTPDLLYSTSEQFTNNPVHVVLLNTVNGLELATSIDIPALAQIASIGGPPAWGDYNNDGMLDALVPPGGTTTQGTVVQNFGANPTSAPTAPTNLTFTTGADNSVRLAWDAPIDDNTTSAALTYSIRIGTTPGGSDVMSAPALADGTRLVSAPGAYSTPFATVSGLTANVTYYWEVQAVDATGRGSAFNGGSFTFNHPPEAHTLVAFTQEDTPFLTAANFLNGVHDQDPGDTIQAIRIDALPTRGTLLYQGGAVLVGDVIPVTGPDYNPSSWLTYVPDANIGNFTDPSDAIGYSATDGVAFGNTAELLIYVYPITDTPTVSVSDITIGADVLSAFPITAGSPDTDGSETVTITLKGIPSGAVLSAGTRQGADWVLTSDQLVGLQIVAPLSMPPSASFDVTVVVTSQENGSNAQWVQDTFTVTVERPTISSITVPATGVEGTPIGLSATGIDSSGAGLTYTWRVHSFNEDFELTGATVSFTPPDNGPYIAILMVTDGLGAVAHGNPQFIDVANVAPVMSSVTNSGPVDEGSSVTITVGATDVAGVYDPLNVRFDYDNDGIYESLDPTHVFPIQGAYVVGVQIDDGDGGIVTGSTTVTVTHANPTTPTDSDNTTDVVVEGAANGATVGITAASSQLNSLPITYSLTNNAGLFAIHPTTGVITVANGSMLNYETATSHTITVQADDGAGGLSTADFTITITNANPSAITDTDDEANAVVEGAVNGTAVGITASASDVNGPGVTFSLTKDAGGRFAIDSTTGVVTVASATLLDYETATSHTITVQASDGKGGTSTADFTITVTNANPTAPADIDHTSNSIVEGAATGTVVGITASASDVNGPGVTFSLTNDAGGGFAIDPTTGVVTVADGTVLDYETATSYTITVQASDGAGGTAMSDFTIAVTNANPTQPADSDSTANSVVEGVANGTPVGITASASDVNGPSMTYSLTNSANGRFTIDSTTGVVTVANGSMLNYETATSHTITVQADDGAGGLSTADFTITVTNANPSVLTDTDDEANAVVEGAANGTAVGITASASDVNGPGVTFSLTKDAGGRFVIDSTTGVVTVADATLLDYETATSHTITVQASDGKGGTSTADFSITVTNANPTTPVDANPSGNAVVKGAANGSVVGITASATDPNGSEVTYSLTDDAGGRFTIDSSTGVVTVADGSRFDFVTAASHTITVQARDEVGGTSSQSFTINVRPVPAVTSLSQTVGIVAGGTVVTIMGTHFTGVTAVSFGGKPAAFTVVSDTKITATSPAGTPGIIDVTVTTLGGTSVTTTSDRFTYIEPAAFAVGGADGIVRLLDEAGTLIRSVRPIAGYKGLVSVARGDFNGDTIPDLLVAAANPAGIAGLTAVKAGKVFVYDGAALNKGTLSLIRTFTPFAKHDAGKPSPLPYTNGLNIAVGDVDGDGHADLVAGTHGGNGTTAGKIEIGRLVVIDGTSPVGTNVIIGGIQKSFGPGYQKGVIVAVGNVDGLGGDEIAVTRGGGPVASPDPAVQQIKVKVLQLKDSALRELPLSADGTTAFAPFAGLSGAAKRINSNSRVSFVDSNGDGKDELVFSALDPLTNPNNVRVRVGVYSIDPAASKGAATIISAGPDAGTYLIGTAVKVHAITHVAATGSQQNIALLTQSATSVAVYLAPLTGGVQTGGFSLNVLTGGIAIAGL